MEKLSQTTPHDPAGQEDGSPGGRPHGSAPSGAEALILLDPDLRIPGSGTPVALEPLLGRSPLERHLHHLASLGVERCGILLRETGEPELRTRTERACRRRIEARGPEGMHVELQEAGPSSPGGNDTVLLVEAEAVYDPRLYELLHRRDGPVRLVDRPDAGEGSDGEAGSDGGGGSGGDDEIPIGLARVPRLRIQASPGAERADRDPPAEELRVEALPRYLPSMRRRLRPYWCRIHSQEDRRRAERMLLDSVQKGVLDFPARYLHPLPENLLAAACSRTGVTPNQVTLLTGVIAFGATALFATAHYGWGVLLALVANVLDGVDGKLARIKLQSSRFGDRLDHTLDVTFEFSWYLALGWGLREAPGDTGPLLAGAGLVGVMLGCRAISGVYRWITGRSIHDHRAFDRAFRLVAGRRNIHVLVLLAGVLLGEPWAALAVMLAWGGATLLVYLLRTVVAAVATARSSPGASPSTTAGPTTERTSASRKSEPGAK